MGVADLYQTRLRGDYHIVDAVQHLFRYRTGHIHNSNDGHRITYGLFNTMLRQIARDKGGIVHENTNQTVLTKEDLKELLETKTDIA